MTTDVVEIQARIRSLSVEERTRLVRELISDLDGPADAEVERAWLEEAQKRHRDIVDGKVQAIPGDRVFESLRARLKR
jgi:putative addiction module component (TIGR02574 family)